MQPAEPADLLGTDLDLDSPLERRPLDCPLPLTGSQRHALTFLRQQRRSNGGAVVNAVQLLGELSIEVLRASLAAVIARHESLRTRIVVVDGVARQHIDPPGPGELEVIDLSDLSMPDAERAAAQLALLLVEREFDLAVGPLFTAKLFRFAPSAHVLVLALEHMVSDGASCEILGNELWALYDLGVQGLAMSLPELRVQFGDYAVWQQRTERAWRRQNEAYWLERLTGASGVEIRTDYVSERAGRASAVVHAPFGKRLSDALRELSARKQVSLPLTVLTIYLWVMARHCESNDLLCVLISHGRHSHPELRGMIGFLASRLHLRVMLREQDRFVDVLDTVKHEFRNAREHCDFDRVPELLPQCRTELGFNWVDNARRAQPAPAASARALRIRPFPLKMTWPSKLHAFFGDTPAGVIVSLAYRPDLFETHTISQLAEQVRLAAQNFANDPLSVARDACERRVYASS